MAYYDYYRSAPGWGTSSYQFVSPRVPSYQPQPNWGGLDYYNAHGGADPYVYDYARNRVLSHSSAGLSLEEARAWHRRAYGGLGDIRTMLPSEVGAAAAYEAWRNWKHHYGVYGQPIADDRERQRDALIGLATSEAGRLLDYTGRSHDNYSRLEAVESAAGTATRILYSTWSLDGGGAYDSYAPSSPIVGFAAPGSLSRRASVASLRGRTLSRPSSPFMSDAYSGVGSAYGGAPGSVYGDAYGDAYSDTGTTSAALMRRRSSFSSTPAMSVSPGVQYAASYSGMPASPTAYTSTSAYGGYGATPGYTNSAYYGQQQPGAVTIIQQPSSHGHRRHRSSSRHRSHRRSSSHHRSGNRYSSYGVPEAAGYYVPSTIAYGY